MGKFAKKFIRRLVKKISNLSDNEFSEEAYIQYLDKINLIGEPVIKNSVRSFLDKKFGDLLVLTNRQKELTKELSIINNRLSNNGAD